MENLTRIFYLTLSFSFLLPPSSFKYSFAQSIDVKSYRLVLTLDPAERYITGSVSTCFVPSVEDLTEVTFDLSDSLRVTAVRYHGELLSNFNHQNNKLTIPILTSPAHHLPPSSFLLPPFTSNLDSIMVDYQGVPPVNSEGSFATDQHDGVPVLFTLSEPYGARDWWPCKQDLNDKADSVHLVLIVPPEYRAAANGMLVSEEHCCGHSTYQWKHKHPIAAYLVGVAVTNYAVYSDWVPLDNIGIKDSIEILNYVYPETLTETRAQTPQLIKPFQLFNLLFGLYPYADERYGHAQWNYGGGMEHQTMSFMGSFGYDLLAHELAHQWFGNYITCGSWQDIWLNEGFATYLVGLCYERDQEGIYWEPFKRLSINHVLREPGGSVFCYDTTEVERVFDSRLSYSKGAMVLHMLRWEMGDEHFFTALNNYLHDPDHTNGFVVTSDLIEHCEAVADTSFTEFFNDWVYGSGYPIYHLQFRRGESADILLQVSQETSDPSVDFFEMHLPIRIYGNSALTHHASRITHHVSRIKDFEYGTIIYTDTVLHHTSSGQVFRLDPGFVIDSIQFDPDRWICTANATIMNVDEIPLDQQIRIYPNPLKDRLFIECPAQSGEITAALYDLKGRKVFEKRYPGGDTLVEMEVGNLRAGVYVVGVRAGGHVVSRRVVVE